jgi:hypothetical protein
VIRFLSKSAFLSMAGAAILLGGCTTTADVQHAQSTADQALEAAQHAQHTADDALSAAHGAQQGVDQMRQEERSEHHGGERG